MVLSCVSQVTSADFFGLFVRDLETIEVFSRTSHTARWHVLQHLQAWTSIPHHLGDLILDVDRREASLVDVENEASAIRRTLGLHG